MSKIKKWSEKDLAVLEILKDYKYGKEFFCKKCFQTEYVNGKTPFSRRCKNTLCRYEESLLKYTALEGLRFPVEKAYQILCELIDSNEADEHEEWIILKPLQGGGYTTGESEEDQNSTDPISRDTLFMHYKRGDISKTQMKRIYSKIEQETIITLKGLAKRHGLQENTVAKFIRKIDERVLLDNSNAEKLTLDRVLDYIHGWSLNKLLGFVMIPLDSQCYRGERKVKGRWYEIKPPADENKSLRWTLEPVIFMRENSEGNLTKYYNKPDEPDYLYDH